MAPRPLEGELTSSWLYRVAAANLVELEELLSGLLDLHPEMHSNTNICLDYGIAPAWSRALAIWCRLAESRIHTNRSKMACRYTDVQNGRWRS